MSRPRAHAPDAPGSRAADAPRYQLLGRLASGGMGTVYLGVPDDGAEDANLVAIKIIHEHLAENRMFVHMLLDEANLARRIDHPNVVGIVDVGEFQGRHFVVMPYIEGGTLSELARKHEQKLPIGHVVRVIIDALTGLHAAHAMIDERGKPLRIVHRDVSPGNLLVGTDGAARVIDFGVAKAASRMTHTAPGIVKGKFSYMAPEQALGEKIDHRADVFSAGVVLWTMLTGQRLFTGETSAHTIRNLMNAEVPPPSRVRPQVPKCFDEVCFRALQRLPAKRYQSAAEMAEELYTAAIIAETLSPAEDVGRWVHQTLATRIDRRREVIAERRDAAPERPSFQLGVGDLDRESRDTSTPLTPSARLQASSSAIEASASLTPQGRPGARGSQEPPASAPSNHDHERVSGRKPGRGQNQEMAGPRWLRPLLWALLFLTTVGIAAVLMRDRWQALLGGGGAPPPGQHVVAPAGTFVGAPASADGARPPAVPPGAAPPLPIVIEQPVVIPVADADAADAAPAGGVDAGVDAGMDAGMDAGVDASLGADAAPATRDPGASAEEDRSERRRSRSRSAKRRSSRREAERKRRKREAAEKHDTRRRERKRDPALEIEDNPYLDE